MATDTLTARNHDTTLTPAGGIAISGKWKTISGGGLTAENTKNRPGGMGQEETIPGIPTREDLTITREYKTSRDAALIGPGGTLEVGLKNGDIYTVTSQDLNHARQAVGEAKTFTGTIKAVSRADRDSESNEVDTLTVVLSVVA